MARRAAKVDATHAAIAAALRQVGAKVRSTAMVGDDFPDLCVGFRGRTLLIECKTPGKKRTQGQIAFAENWPGEVHTAYSADEALAAVIGKQHLR